MLYKLSDNNLIIYDVIDHSTHQFELSKFNFRKGLKINHAVCTPDRNTVACSFSVLEMDGIRVLKRYEEGILLCRKDSGEIEQIFDKTCHDMIFDKTDKDRLFINTKGVIASLCMSSGEMQKIYKFRNFIEAPIDIKQSSDGKHLLFGRYKADNKKLQLIDMEHQKLLSVIGSVDSYDFLNNEEVVYSLTRGLKIYNINSQKNKILMQDTKKLVCLFGNTPAADLLAEIRRKAVDEGIIIDEVNRPFMFGERLYFRIYIASEGTRFLRWCSVHHSLNDLQIHCEHSQGNGAVHIYGDYEQQIFVFLEWIQEEDSNDRCSGCYIYEDGGMRLLKGYLPISFAL